MDARREKGLCYNCDEKFIRGHRCQRKQLYLMMVDEDKIDDLGQDDQVENERALEDEIQLSMHSLSGSNSFRTMIILGFLRGKAITILIDSGSTHNFVEPGAVRLSGVTIDPTSHLSLTVADGTKLCSEGVCKAFSWMMQGKVFTATVRMLTIGGCDMVWGIQWLSTLGPIIWDFKNLKMQLQPQGKSFILKGNAQSGPCFSQANGQIITASSERLFGPAT